MGTFLFRRSFQVYEAVSATLTVTLKSSTHANLFPTQRALSKVSFFKLLTHKPRARKEGIYRFYLDGYTLGFHLLN